LAQKEAMPVPADDVAAAVRVLIVGGVGNLVLSFALGWVLAGRRLKQPIESHRWLLTAHEVSLQEGLMLLGLAFAMGFVQLDRSWALVAAWLLVVASVLQDLSGIVNWLVGTGDQFAERSTGWRLATLNAVTNTAGLLIVAWGVIRALLP
jgi:hypothetical protein